MKYRLPARFALLLAALPAALVGTTFLISVLRAQSPGAGPVLIQPLPPITDPMTVPAIVPLPEVESPEASAAAQPVPRPDPKTLLDQATDLLARRRSITCKLRLQADLFGKPFVGSGSYAQGPSSSRWMRYELRMQVGAREVYQLQVNDGRYLWQQRQYKETPSLQRVDVDKVLNAAAGQGGANGLNHDAVTILGLGGLGRLLEVLRKDFDLNSVFRSQLKADPTDIDVYGIEGRWRPEALQKLNVVSAAKLREHVPDRVVLYLGCDDFFPYRIEYLRDRASANPNAQPESYPLLVLELYERQFDAAVDEAMFRFNAGSQPFLDVTDRAITARTSLP